MNSGPSSPRLSFRLVLGPDIAIGPGKADLLDAVAKTGSISAAGRSMGMSYKKAWYLLDSRHHSPFRELRCRAVRPLDWLELAMTATPFNLSSGSFVQNWSNTGLITTNDDWSTVPSIIGYLGQDITTATGADPQTAYLGVSTTGFDVDVIANQTNPGIVAGRVAEFEIAKPAGHLDEKFEHALAKRSRRSSEAAAPLAPPVQLGAVVDPLSRRRCKQWEAGQKVASKERYDQPFKTR